MLTLAQLQALKADIAANTNTIPAGKTWTNNFAGMQVKDVPAGGDGDFTVAAWYSQVAAPDFFVFRSNISPSEIFDQVTWANFTPADAPDASVTWSNRSLCCQGKQFNLQILLQGQSSFNAGRINVRAGLNDATTNLPSGPSGASRSGGWSGILSILRRQALYIEKLLSSQTTGVGTNSGDALGATTNPALMGYEGTINANDIDLARNS